MTSASLMASSFELDPVFVKALKLLQSKTKESTEQLKQMLDDVIKQRKSKISVSEDAERGSAVKVHVKKDSEFKKDLEKRDVEKLKNELAELSSMEAKKQKLNLTSSVVPSREFSKKVVDSIEASKAQSLTQDDSMDESSDTIVDSEDNKNIDADEFAFDLGIACSECRSFEVTTGNQLVECLECHNLYHQECHKPPVIEEDVNDPRFVWYCSRCSKTLKKMVAKPPKGKVTLASGPVKEQELQVKSSKLPAATTNLFQFKRSELKVSANKDGGSSVVAKPMSGFESLAANLSGRNLTNDASLSIKNKLDQLKQISWSKTGSSKSSMPSSKLDSKADVSLIGSSSKSVDSNTKASYLPGSTTLAAINAEKKLQFVKKRVASSRLVTDRKHYK